MDDLLHEDVTTARKRADLALSGHDDFVFDSRGARIAKSSLGAGFEDEFDEEVRIFGMFVNAEKH